MKFGFELRAFHHFNCFVKFSEREDRLISYHRESVEGTIKNHEEGTSSVRENEETVIS